MANNIYSTLDPQFNEAMGTGLYVDPKMTALPKKNGPSGFSERNNKHRVKDINHPKEEPLRQQRTLKLAQITVILEIGHRHINHIIQNIQQLHNERIHQHQEVLKQDLREIFRSLKHISRYLMRHPQLQKGNPNGDRNRSSQ